MGFIELASKRVVKTLFIKHIYAKFGEHDGDGGEMGEDCGGGIMGEDGGVGGGGGLVSKCSIYENRY